MYKDILPANINKIECKLNDNLYSACTQWKNALI